ncbi:hypothetical protein [Stutzerimonas nosocomialis]|uniref:hypothetical protein n=1 Tax=Stutzerimonas nosocomialis TaxID=1056496 RepID=UPI0011090FA3|nr:hypothetical protein [Stutzerimonas nosocomialis]
MTEDQVRLLMRICGSAGTHSLCLAKKLMSSSISSSEVDELCELISNEFMLNGIEENFEPNDYGRKLEHLLDAVNSGRLRES